MANTIILKDFLVKETIDLLDRNMVVAPRGNRQFEGQLKQQGDTVTVQTFPRITITTGGTAGDDISATDWAITAENLQVVGVAQANAVVKDVEALKSNLNLQQEVAKGLAYSLSKIYDNDIMQKAIAGAGNAVATIALSATNIYAEIEKMRVLLSADDAMDDAALFLTPAAASFLRQSSMRDGFKEGSDVRKERTYVGKVSGFSVFETTNDAMAGFMVAFDRNAVHFVEQMMKMDFRKEPKGFRTNIILEALYQSKVFTNNANRICKHAYT